MANDSSYKDETMSEEIAENPGMRAAALRANPSLSLEEARNAAAGETPNAAGGPAGSSGEDYVSSISDPNPTNIPSTDHPLPDDADNSDEETMGDASSRSEKSDDRYAH
jgi:hypothetical protein